MSGGNTMVETERFEGPSLATTAGLAALIVAFLGAIALLASAIDVTFGTLSRDVFSVASAPVYTGAMSNIGVFVWISGSVCCLLTASVLYRRSDRGPLFPFFLQAGLLAALLAFDDFFMIHERLEPFGMDEKPVLATYAVAAMAFLWWNRETIMHHTIIGPNKWWLVLAFVCFAISLLVDRRQSVIQTAIGNLRIIFEDGFKFAGIVWWTAYLTTNASRILSSLIGSDRQPATGDREPVPASAAQ